MKSETGALLSMDKPRKGLVTSTSKRLDTMRLSPYDVVPVC